ncbi:receptor-transporting protein 3-like [Alosa sapidissima]|uniref:receptor-transporting protein 3-like n=1 Tax=Alosa sapidissima TaxID=34773 RepID=UPI001C095E90|nr:receptor-transporting protein 3-like [Alosa sapidissima]
MSLQEWQGIFAKKAVKLHGHHWSIEFDDSIVPDNTAQHWFQYIRGAFLLCQGVKVRRFRQECRECFGAEMEEPQFEQENIDVMLEKLGEKICIRCYQDNLGENSRQFRPHQWYGDPHESSHCEACKKGICRQSD